MKIVVKRLFADALMPSYQTANSACFDLHANEDGYIYPGETSVFGTGLAMEIPEGFVGEVVPRSGLAAKNSITVLNAPGQIDPDYRGEIKVILHNLGTHRFEVKKGDRIAQMKITPFIRAWLAFGELSETERGEGGLGSTGV